MSAVPPKVVWKLEDFDILQTLGTGSFGRVSLVLHRPSSIYMAMKKLRKADVIRLKQVEHTNNECNILSTISFHPFLVKLIATFQDDLHLYLVMEYVGGGELFNLLRRTKTLPPFVARFYAAEVILAIGFLHERGIIYRDLKPENILIAPDGHIRLTDFGFAKVIGNFNGSYRHSGDEEGGDDQSNEKAPPQCTWTLCGTPDYLAPEIVLSKGYGAPVDWYALGILIYEMLTGTPPFYSENQMKLYENIVHSPLSFPPDFDPIAKDLIMSLLDKNPTFRLGSSPVGVHDIMRHSWFRDVPWETLLAKKIRPPFLPQIKHAGDTSNFDTYPDEEEVAAVGKDCIESWYSLFPTFGPT